MKPFFSTAPTLETERLRLRAFRLDDFASFDAVFQDPEESRFLGGMIPTGESWRKFVFNTGHWALMGYGWWIVADKATDKYVGLVGFADFKRDMEPRLPDGTPEMGWAFLSRYHGKGFATESAKCAMAWHDQTLKFPCVAAVIDAGNAPSRKIAAKLGFREVGESILRGKPILRFERRLF